MSARFGCDQHFRPPKRHSSVSIRGLKFWSPYVCPIWVRPEFQAAKATQLGVNSKLLARKDARSHPKSRIGRRGVARRRTRAHEVARGRTRLHEGARGHTRSHEGAHGRTRSDEGARGRRRAHEGARGRTRSHEGARGRTGCQLGVEVGIARKNA